MRIKLRVLLILSVLMMSSISCNLATLVQNANATATAEALAGTVSQNTSGSTENTISAIHLTANDLPAGFVPISTDEMEQMGISASTFTSLISGFLSQATTQNTDAYINPATNEVAVSSIVASLNGLERTGFDLFLADPQPVLAQIQNQAEGTTVSQNNTAAIGDTSLIFDSLTTQGPISMAGQGVISRHAGIVQITLYFYPAGSNVSTSAITIANILDSKFSAVE